MGDHQQFGKPPTLRPRSAGVSRASPRSLGPEQLAINAMATASAASLLNERLHMPRPGSAASASAKMDRPPRSAPMATGSTTTATTIPTQSHVIQPATLLSRPPMRPKSAMPGAGVRGIVSQHRKDAIKDSTPSSNQSGADTLPLPVQQPHLAPQLQRVALSSTKEDGLRPHQSTASIGISNETTKQPTRPQLKRPFSAAPTFAPVSIVPEATPHQASSSASHSRPQSKMTDAPPRSKRPYSAAPDMMARGVSRRSTNLIVSLRSTTADQPVQNEADTPEADARMPEKVSREQPLGLSSNAMAIMSTFHRDTFVYAVPRHCLQRGLQYNPYDIVTVSHEALFGPNDLGRTARVARFDYYTVSATGLTFHCLDDHFEPSFLLTSEWERQKASFSAISKFPTFQLFRYRKAFVGWKRWIRATKIDTARAVLLSTLYFSQPLLNRGMQAIQQELLKIELLDLLCDFDGKTHHVSQFSAKNSDHVQRQGFALLKISGRIQQILLQVCHESLTSTENPYGGFPGHQFALSTRKSSNFHIFEAFIERERALATAHNQLIQHEHFQGTAEQPQVSPSKAAQLRISHRKQLERTARARMQRSDEPLDEIRWTMAAIQRRRCLLLTKFVALVDFMVLDAFHSLLLRSVQRLRDTLWVGANAVPIARLTSREDFVLAFHRTLDSRQASTDTTASALARTGGGRGGSAIALNKQQTKRFLRAAWEPKMAVLLRGSGATTASETQASGEPLKSSKAVWMESRLDAFFLHALAQHTSADADQYTLEDLMFVVERSFASVLVLPDFDASRCDIKEPSSSEASQQDSDARPSDIQQVETLAPVALFHMSLDLHVEDAASKAASISFKPTLDRVVAVVQDALASFLELFQGVPSIVIHQELRAILEFADDFRAASIGDRGAAMEETKADDEGEEGEASRWNKSNYERLYSRVANDRSFVMLRQNIEELTRSAVEGAQAFAALYASTLATYTRNELLDVEQHRQRFRNGEYSLREMEADAVAFQAQIDTLQRFKVAQMVEFLQCDMVRLKEALLPSPTRCLAQLHVLFPSLAAEKCHAFLAFVRRACQLTEKPHGSDRLEAFAKYLLHLRDVQDQVDTHEFDLTYLHDLLRLLHRLGVAIPGDVMQLFELCDPEFEALKTQMNEALARRDADIHAHTPTLLEHVKKLSGGVETLKTQSSDQTMVSGESVAHEAREMAHALETHAGELTQQATQLVWVQRVFNEFAHGSRPPFEEFSDLQYVAHELKLKNELWEAVYDAEKYLGAKQDETLRLLDLGQLKSLQGHVETVLKRLQTNALQIAAVARLQSCRSILEGLSPVIRDLRNEALEERHWTKLEHKMSCSFVRHVTAKAAAAAEGEEEEEGQASTAKEIKFLDLPLRHLLEVDAVRHGALIHQVSEEATAEAAIAKSFHAVAQTWDTRELPSHFKKDRDGRDAVWLGDCSELRSLIEESEVLLRVMESSSFARVVHSKLSRLLHDLALTKETVALLAACQQKWEYLQRLVSVDFVRSFPEQSKALQAHDASWKSIMDGVAKRPLCLPFGVHPEHRPLLQAILHGFESAACCLEQHLEMKRQCFPAFFQLSNLELATLLAKVRDVQCVQQFLYQCFDNVARVNFGTREACQDIQSLRSRAFPIAETIPMGKNLKARGPPEQWLVAIEKRLVEVLRKGTKEAVALLAHACAPATATATALDTAALHALPLQCIVLADRILRAELIDSLLVDEEDAIASVATAAAQELVFAKLHQHHATMMARLFAGSAVHDSAGPVHLTRRELALLACLRLHEIEFRDCVAEHFGRGGGGGGGLGLGVQWGLQLKHRFDDSTTVGYDCHVEMDGTRVPYGFNYVNVMAASDLVFSPRSARFVYAVFAATRHAQTALLTGPPGSGKASVAVQMSTLLGRRLFRWCAASSALGQLAHFTKLLRGALLSGGVLCFAIDSLALLRTVGAMVHKIEHAVLCKLPIVDLQKEPIVWVPGTTLLVSHRLPVAADSRHSLDTIAASFARVSVVTDHSVEVVLEALAHAKQLESPRETAQQLVQLWSHLSSLEIGAPQHFFSLHSAKQVVALAAEGVWLNAEPFERLALQNYLLAEAVMAVCQPLFASSASAKTRVVEALNSIVHYDKHEREWYAKQWRRQQAARDAAELKKCEEMVEDAAHELQYLPRRSLVGKAVELAQGLVASVSAIVVGPSGVGKTATVSVLAKALDRWKHELVDECHSLQQATASTGEAPSKAAGPGPLVSVRVVIPKALTLAQFVGSTALDAKGQPKSLLARLLREAQEAYALSTDHELQHATDHASTRSLASLLALQQLTWIVFDGGAVCGGGEWLEVLLAVLSRRPVCGRLETSPSLVGFGDGEFMTLPPSVRFVFEAWRLDNASPAVLHNSAVVVFPHEPAASDEDENLPVHYACIHRFIEQHRVAARGEPRLTAVVYDTVANRLLGSDVLAKIFLVIEDYGVAVHLGLLQRVEYLLSMLQALLSHVAAVCTASRKPPPGEAPTSSSSPSIPEEDVVHRVEMAIVYALLWGFSACTSAQREGDGRALQLLISGMLKAQFESIAHAWEDCGRDANLFELLLDLNGLRFVSLESGDAAILRDKLWRHSVASHAPASHALLFVPTASSLVVHAAMKEALRSARGVLLVGGDTSRKTTLLQSFLKQLQPLKVLTTSNYASLPPIATAAAADATEAGSASAKRRRAVPLNRPPLLPAVESAFASLDRMRLHQVGLVKRLAKRFRKVNKATAMAAAMVLAQRHAKQPVAVDSEADTKAKGPKKEPDWAIPAHLDAAKAGMVAKFDLDDFIPFFFAMNQHDRGVLELAKCLERMLQRERSGIYEPPPGKTAVLLIDDLHLPLEDDASPSCHAFLRAAYEHGSVLSLDDAASAIAIESLMMVASIAAHAMPQAATARRHASLDKLARQLLPVYAAPCSLLELHSIFHPLVVAQWEEKDKLSAVVRMALPTMVAAVTALWHKLQQRAMSSSQRCVFHLHDLARVFAGVCAVDPSYLLDAETMARLVAHEALRSFGDCQAGSADPQWRAALRSDLLRLRVLLDGLDRQPAAKPQDTRASNNLHTGTNAVGLLGFFTAELATGDGKKPTAAEAAAYERKNLHRIHRWAYVASSIYYQASSSNSSASASSTSTPAPLQRRNSIKFIRRKSLEANAETTSAVADVVHATLAKRPSLGNNSRWIYAELPLADGDHSLDDSAGPVIQGLFAGLRIFGSSTASPPTDLLLQMQVAQLPRAAPPVTAAIAHSLATLERVFCVAGARVALLGPPGSGREWMVRYACAVRHAAQPHRVWTVDGVANAHAMAAKWRHVVHQLFAIVGVDCASVTLLVKNVGAWPASLLSELLALIVAGEIPGAFTLDEQIKLATKVRDERLIDLEHKYQSQVARVRHELELQKEQEMLLSQANYQELERTYQQLLLVRLSQLQLRHQQELDDYARKCEVENESVAATIMSLMRPLGMTSGKWQQIVQRVRRRLKIVVLLDRHEATRLPQLLRVCSVASLAPLDSESLHVLLFGSLHSETQAAFRLERKGVFSSSTSAEDRADLVQFVDRLDHALPSLAALAAEMHRAAVALAKRDHRVVPTEAAAVQLAGFFPRLVRALYASEREAQRKTEWFLYVHASMETALWKLQDRDGELQAQLLACDQQIAASTALLAEQTQDCDRLRDMMKRFQAAAEDQVHTTNEMELRAQAELHVPLACVEEANASLLLLDKRHIVEIKSFNSPPLLVHLVLDAVCVLFRLEPAWENARRLLADANVVHSLLSFDKDSISVEVLAKLEASYVSDPRFNRDEVEKQSVAASMMVVWVRAMYQYASARRLVLPTLHKLEQAQARLTLLMSEYQTSKQRAVDADAALATTRATLLQAEQQRQQTVDDMASRKARLDGGRVVLEILKQDKREVDAVARRAERERALGLTWWNALLAAGAMSYARWFDAGDRRKLFEAWGEAYTRLGGEARVGFVPAVSIRVADEEEEEEEEDPHDPLWLFRERRGASSQWEELASACGFLFSSRNLQDAWLLSHANSAGLHVSLVTSYSVEMETLLVTCARHMWHWTQLYMVSASASDLLATVATAVAQGHQLLILDVHPLDVEYGLGRLSGLYHWRVEGEDSSERLVLSDEASVPIHASFRAVLATHETAEAFGGSPTLTPRVPVISATLHECEVADVLLDKLWHPGLFEGGQHGVGLKQSVREFERLARQREAAEAALTKLLQGAAVRGQFQRHETDEIREACQATQRLRSALADKRRDVGERIRTVHKQQTLARLGAAIFSGFNMAAPSRLSLHVYLPMWTAALRRPPPATQSMNSAPGALKRLGSTVNNNSNSPGLLLRTASRAVMLSQLPQAQGKAVGLDSVSEVLRKMLRQLQPLVRDAGHWYKFVVHTLWLLERQYAVDLGVAHAAAVVAVDEARPLRLTRLLSLVKLSRWKSEALCASDYIDLPSSVADSSRVVALVVNGHAGVDGSVAETDELSTVLAASRCRAERVKTTVALYPQLLRPLCDRILLVYGVQVRFTTCENEDPVDGVDHTSTADDAHAAVSSTGEALQPKTSWLHTLDGFPEVTCLLLHSSFDFASFVFLRRVFASTLATRAARLATLQAAVAREMRCQSELQDVFYLPNTRLNPGQRSTAVATIVDEIHTALMLEDPVTLVRMDRDKLEAFLDDLPLAIVNLLEGGAPVASHTRWEDLYHLLNPSPQRTTSTELRRFDHTPSTTAMAVSLASSTRPQAARRMSTQNLPHRRSDAAALLSQAATLPPLVFTVRDASDVPWHLRPTTVALAEDATDLAASASPPSFGKCLEDSLLRLAFHPCHRQLAASCQDGDATARLLLFHSLTALVVFHSVLLFRSRLLLRQYTALGSLDPRVGSFSWDAFTTALDQLLLVLRGKSARALPAVMARLTLHVFLAPYARQTRSTHELAVLKLLARECVGLVQDSLAVDGTNTSASSASDAALATRLQSAPGLSSARSSRSHRVLHASSTASSAASSRRLPHRRSSLGDLTLSLLSGLNLPLDELRASGCQDVGAWIQLMWTYAGEGIDQSVESHVRDLFGLLPATEELELLHHPYASVTASHWVGLFGWLKQPPRYGCVAAQVAMEDALRCLRVVRDTILPAAMAPDTLAGSGEVLVPGCGSDSASGEGEDQVVDGGVDESATEEQEESTPASDPSTEDAAIEAATVDESTPSPLLDQLLQALIQQYNGHVQSILALLNELIGELERWRLSQTTSHLETLQAIPSAHARDTVLAVLCNQVPPSLRDAMAKSSTYLMASASLTLDETLALLQRRQLCLLSLQQSLRFNSSLLDWWLPGIPQCVAVHYLVRLSKIHSGSTSRDGEWTVAYTLRVDLDPEDPEVPEVPADTIASLSGLELRFAVWDTDRGYLQPLDRHSSRVPQRVSVLCRLERVRSDVTTAKPSLLSKRQHLTRSCPLLSRNDVVHAFDLPVGPAFGSLLAPCLLFATP